MTVSIPGHPSYEVIIEPKSLTGIGNRIVSLFSCAKAVIISDSRTAYHWQEPLERSLRSAGIEPIVATFNGGESNKTLTTVCKLFDELLPHRIDRRTPVLALGGGIVGDLGGFIAGTLLRGVPLVQVPTTLLAMVDASVGGKTGVNHDVGKNLIGVFHQPSLVCIDPETLKTLLGGELRAGLAECIKHEIIRDANGFADLENNIERALKLDIDYLAGLVAHNVSIKARVVEADPLEHGERAHLNLGHTFAHAFEKVSQHKLSHGSAVALGLCAAARLACSIGILKDAAVDRIIALIKRAELPTQQHFDADDVLGAMAFDKKVVGGKLRFILPDRIGHAVIRDDLPVASVRAAVESLRPSSR